MGILDLSDASAIPWYSAGDELTIRVKDLDSDTVLEQLSRLLTVSEINAGLVRENFAIQLMPEIEVASVLDFGAVYAGVVSQRQLEISNTGIGVLNIRGTSVSSGLSVEPSSLNVAAGSSQNVTVSLVAPASFSTGNLTLASNDTDESSLTVEVRAQVDALTAGGDDQLLTITGEVSGQLSGNTQVYVSLGSFSSQETLTAAGGSYRFTILDLSDASTIPWYSAGDELTI